MNKEGVSQSGFSQLFRGKKRFVYFDVFLLALEFVSFIPPTIIEIEWTKATLLGGKREREDKVEEFTHPFTLSTAAIPS